MVNFAQTNIMSDNTLLQIIMMVVIIITAIIRFTAETQEAFYALEPALTDFVNVAATLEAQIQTAVVAATSAGTYLSNINIDGSYNPLIDELNRFILTGNSIIEEIGILGPSVSGIFNILKNITTFSTLADVTDIVNRFNSIYIATLDIATYVARLEEIGIFASNGMQNVINSGLDENIILSPAFTVSDFSQAAYEALQSVRNFDVSFRSTDLTVPKID